MINLDKMPKKMQRQVKWLVFWLFFLIGLLLSHDIAASLWLFLGSIAVIFTPTKQVIRWVFPVTLVLFVISMPSLGLLTQSIFVGLLVVSQQLLFIPHTKLQQITYQPIYKINTSKLTRRDLRFFKATFKRLKKSTKHIENLLQETVGLRRIGVETKVTTFINGILQELADHPTQLTTVDEFAYRHLPDLEELLVSYVSIANHSVISDYDKKQLKEARQLIRNLIVKIHEDYQLIIREDMDNLNMRMNTAKQTLGDDHE